MSTNSSKRSASIGAYVESKRKSLVTKKQADLSKATRDLYHAAGWIDPAAEIVRDLARVTGDTVADELPRLVERARRLRAAGGV